jgi:hypothetical protein
MFEKYDTEELFRIGYSTKNEDMLAEYHCRQIAEKYKAISDKDLEDLEFYLYTHPCRSTSKRESVSLENYRRGMKAEGVTELPVRIEIPDFTPEEIICNNKLDKLVYLQRRIEEEKNSSNLDTEKIKNLEQELAVCNKELHDLHIILDEKEE